jgi:hypothetical protein
VQWRLVPITCRLNWREHASDECDRCGLIKASVVKLDAFVTGKKIVKGVDFPNRAKPSGRVERVDGCVPPAIIHHPRGVAAMLKYPTRLIPLDVMGQHEGEGRLAQGRYSPNRRATLH